EIARTVKRAVADVIDLPPSLRAFDALDRRQYRVPDSAERPRDERRADEFGRIAGAERDHAPTKALRHRQRHQIAAEIDDILEIVLQADAIDRVFTDSLAVFRQQTDRPADAGVEIKIGGQWNGDDARFQVGFHQIAWLAACCLLTFDRPDIERRMRPCGLGQIFDHAGN